MTPTPPKSEPATARRAMAERPISYTPEMIRAQLDDRKDQTRRTITRLLRFGPITEFGPSTTPGYDWHFRDRELRWHDLTHEELLAVCPYGVVGDRLWAKEAWATWMHAPDLPEVGGALSRDPDQWLYRADGENEWSVMKSDMGALKSEQCGREKRNGNWAIRNARYMPRWASRLTNILTEVRIEQVQDISEADAIAEGIETAPVVIGGLTEPAYHAGVGDKTVAWSAHPTDAFFDLWDHINADRGHGVNANPWVWVLGFDVIRTNIDQIGERDG